MSTNQTSAIVLAAGSSTRMGQPKQLLRLRNTTVLNQTLANLQQSSIEEIILVLGAHAEAIQPTLPANLKTVHNPDYQQGMATSLHAGLAALNPAAKAALIVLADQPFIRPETLTQLAHHAASAPILIPAFRGRRGNPVRLDRSLFPEVFALRGDVGCRALFSLHPVELLKVDDQGILQDLDTPDDYQELKESTPTRTAGSPPSGSSR